MNVEEITVAALSRALDFSNEVPTTRSVHYRRISVRQQQLFVRAAEINPDYFGLTESLNLVAGVADLSALSRQAERVAGVRINDAGTSPYAAGDAVNIIPLDDPGGSLAPRATLRDYKLTGYNGELNLVTSVNIDYSKRPNDLAVATDEPELPEQFHELLVIDDAKATARRMLQVDKQLREDFIALLEQEEAELIADFERHVERFQLAEESRFGRTARPIERPRAES